jgi:hypothetical protein
MIVFSFSWPAFEPPHEGMSEAMWGDGGSECYGVRGIECCWLLAGCLAASSGMWRVALGCGWGEICYWLLTVDCGEWDWSGQQKWVKVFTYIYIWRIYLCNQLLWRWVDECGCSQKSGNNWSKTILNCIIDPYSSTEYGFRVDRCDRWRSRWNFT